MFTKTTLLFALFALIQCKLSAQWYNAPTIISTPNGNVKIKTPFYFRMPQNYLYRGSSSAKQIVSRKYEFTIILLNDSVINAKTRINLSDSIHSLKWTKKGIETVITPSQTKEIYRLDEIGEKIVGKPMGDTWIFLADSGLINTYSVTSDIDDPAIAYIQKGKGAPVILLTEQNLRSMVKDYAEALKLVDEKKLLKAIEFYNREALKVPVKKVLIISGGSVATRIFMDNLSERLAILFGKRKVDCESIFQENLKPAIEYSLNFPDTIRYDAYLVVLPEDKEYLELNKTVAVPVPLLPVTIAANSGNAYKQNFIVRAFGRTDKLNEIWATRLEVDFDLAEKEEYKMLCDNIFDTLIDKYFSFQ